MYKNQKVVTVVKATNNLGEQSFVLPQNLNSNERLSTVEKLTERDALKPQT